MSKVLDENKEALLSLGFAFHGKIPKESADPEKTVTLILSSFFEDRKLFKMLISWLFVTTDLIHIERLNILSKQLPPNLQLVLAAIALKLTRVDRRWKVIYENLKENEKNSILIPEEYTDPYLISKYGIDPEFQKLGIKVCQILPDSEKKILSFSGILKSNTWLRLRALIGPNFRADIAYLYVSKTVTGPAGAARLLKCARGTAYRNWRALEQADIQQMLRISV